MANQKPVTIVQYDEDDPELQSEAKTSHDRGVEDLIDSFKTSGEDVYIQIYRVGHSANDLQFCVQVPADKYDYGGLCEYLRSTFGGADYRLHFRQNGKRGLLENKLLQIAKQNTGIPQIKADGDIGNAIAALGNMMAQNQQQMMAMVERITSKPPQDPMAEMGKMFVLMKSMREAMGLGAAPTATAAAQSPLSAMKELVGMVAALKTLNGEVGGLFGGAEKADGDSWVSLAKDFGPQIVGLFQTQQEIEAGKVATQAAGVVKDAQRPPTITRVDNPSARKPASILPPDIVAILDKVNDLAVANSDPWKVADALMEDEKSANLVRRFSSVPDPYAALCRVYQPAQAHARWYVHLFDALDEILNPEPDSDIQGESQAMNVPGNDGTDALS